MLKYSKSSFQIIVKMAYFQLNFPWKGHMNISDHNTIGKNGKYEGGEVSVERDSDLNQMHLN